MLQRAVPGVRADELPHRHRRIHLAGVVARRRAVRHDAAGVEGPQAGQLVAQLRRPARGLLASPALHAPLRPRHHGRVGRRGRRHQARRRAHSHPDGLRALRRRGVRPGQLLPQPRDGGRRQQPGGGRRLLRHTQGARRRRRRTLGISWRRLGHPLLLRRPGTQPGMPLKEWTE